MKRLILAISLLAVGLTANSQIPREPSVKPKAGLVPNAETAVKVGEAVLMPVTAKNKSSANDHSKPRSTETYGRLKELLIVEVLRARHVWAERQL